MISVGELGDLGQRLFVDGHRLTLIVDVDVAVGRSEGDRGDGYALILGRARRGVGALRVVRIGRHGLLAVRHQHDPRRRRFVTPAEHRSDGGDRLQGGEDGLTGRSAVGELELVERGLGGVPVGGRGDQHGGGAGVGDEAEVDAGGQLIGELFRGLLRGDEPTGLDVGRAHGLGDVDHQHHHRAVAGHAHIVLRPGHGDGQQGQGGDEQDGGQVPPPLRPLRSHPLQQLHVGEPQDALLAGELGQHVEHHECDDDDEEQQEPRVSEVAQRHRTEQRQNHAPAPIIGLPPWLRVAARRRSGRCRRSSRGRCAGSSAARRSAAGFWRPRPGGRPRHGRSRPAVARRW